MRLFGKVECWQNVLHNGSVLAGTLFAGGLNTLSFGNTVLSTSEYSKFNYKQKFEIKIYDNNCSVQCQRIINSS